METELFLDLADNTGDNFLYVAPPVKEWYVIPSHHHQVTLVRSVVRNRKIDSTDELKCCKKSDGFKVFNRHGDELFETEKMDLTHRHSSFTTIMLYLNDDTSKLSTSLPNLEHGLGIDNNKIDNPMSLFNTLFLKAEQLSTPIHKDVNDLKLDPSK